MCKRCLKSIEVFYLMYEVVHFWTYTKPLTVFDTAFRKIRVCNTLGYGIYFMFCLLAEQEKITDTVFSLIRLLLHHALQHEPEGWRIFVDTLAILHGQVYSFCFFKTIFAIFLFRIFIADSLTGNNEIVSIIKSSHINNAA